MELDFPDMFLELIVQSKQKYADWQFSSFLPCSWQWDTGTMMFFLTSSLQSYNCGDSAFFFLSFFQGVNGMSVDEKPDSPMYVYESTVHCTNILLGLNDQRKKDILCDVTLIVERKEFRAHRAVLAACSEYFWQALVGQTKNDLVVSLPEEVQ